MSHEPSAPLSEAEIVDQLRMIVRQKLEYEGELRPEMHLVEDLELDSIRLLTLAMEVEDHFRVRIGEEDEAGIDTVGDLVRVVRRKKAADGEPG